MSKSFPAWTVTRDFWKQALKPEVSGIAVDVRLFHESGKRLIRKYRVYQDPLPHPALREGRITKLLSFVNPGYGYCPAHTSTDRDSFIGESTRGSAKWMLPEDRRTMRDKDAQAGNICVSDSINNWGKWTPPQRTKLRRRPTSQWWL